MILTLTLNPAIDKTTKAKTIIPGQVNRLYDVEEYPGGKGINVTRLIRQLDREVMATGFLGGYNGEFIYGAVEDCGAKSSFVYIEGNTRVNTNILAEDGYFTEILDPGPVITEGKQKEILLVYDCLLDGCTTAVLSGSLPSGVSNDFYRQFIDMAKAKNRKVILDTSSYAIKEGVKSLPYMIKPNIREMEYLTGVKLDSNEKIIDEAVKLQEKGIEIVVVSMGKKGFIHVDKNKIITVKVPSITPVNTVGCGDALVAGYACGIDDCVDGEIDMEMLARKAAALSIANAHTKESGQADMDIYASIADKIEMQVTNR